MPDRITWILPSVPLVRDHVRVAVTNTVCRDFFFHYSELLWQENILMLSQACRASSSSRVKVLEALWV